MYIIGGNEKHGKVNYLHRFNWYPESSNLSNYMDPTTLKTDLTQLLTFDHEQKAFSKFEFVVKNDKDIKLGSLYAPGPIIKFRCPRFYKLSE